MITNKPYKCMVCGHEFKASTNHFGEIYSTPCCGVTPALTEQSHAYGECSLYLGDDGRIYILWSGRLSRGIRRGDYDTQWKINVRLLEAMDPVFEDLFGRKITDQDLPDLLPALERLTERIQGRD